MDSKAYKRTPLTWNEFEAEIENAKLKGKCWDLTDYQINEVIEESLRILENKEDVNTSSTSRSCRSIRKCTALIITFVMQILNLIWWIIVVAGVLYCILSCHNPTQKLVTRHIQDYIYPFMRTFRLFTLPLLKLYPSLVDLHEEQCLVRNPFYKVQNLDCWPCEQVRSVLDLSGLKNFTEYYHHSGIPFVVKDALTQDSSLETLQRIYADNKEVFKRDTPKFLSSDSRLKTLDSFLDPNNHDAFNISKNPEIHVTWKINRAGPARILRERFPKPYFVPEGTEIAIQRFLFFNGPESPAHDLNMRLKDCGGQWGKVINDFVSEGFMWMSHIFLPLTDFANVWITAAGDGERLISLWPASQCSHACSPTSVVLKPGQICRDKPVKLRDCRLNLS